MPKTLLALSLLCLSTIALPADADARGDRKTPGAYGKYDRAPSRASRKSLDSARKRARDSRASRISLSEKTTLAVTAMKPVAWAYLKFLDSVYVSGHGYGDTGYASFAEGEGKAILVTDLDPSQARLVSCGVALQTEQTIKVREAKYGDNIEKKGKTVFSNSLAAGNRTVTFVALGSTEAPKRHYVIEGAGNWNLLYCDVYSSN